MPAGSEVTLPHTWRPLGVRVAAAFFGGLLLLICGVAWFALDESIRAQVTMLERATVLLLALAAGAVGHALVRSRVEAHPDRLVVVNGYRRREYDWPEVVAVRLPRGAPWATLDLSDGTTVPAMGIQGSDGDRARLAVRQLRALLDR